MTTKNSESIIKNIMSKISIFLSTPISMKHSVQANMGIFQNLVNFKIVDKPSTTYNEYNDCIHQVYKGYVDDPSNTDNAWYETTAINYHDSDGTSFAKFPMEVN